MIYVYMGITFTVLFGIGLAIIERNRLLPYCGFIAGFLRGLFYGLALLTAGYLLGNAFPTFEVVPYGYKSLTGNPLSLNLGECAPECEDFNDNIGG